jgi:hypothetical protein
MRLLFLLSVSIAFVSCQSDTEKASNLMSQAKYRQAIEILSKVDSTQMDFRTAKKQLSKCYLELGWQEYIYDSTHTSQISALVDNIDSSIIDINKNSTYSSLICASATQSSTRKLRKLFKAMVVGIYVKKAEQAVTELSAAIEKEAPQELTAANEKEGLQELTASVNSISSDYLGQYYSKKSLFSLHVWKDLGKGIIRIKFSYEYTCPLCRFLVRLFDKNGNYLTHFITETHMALFGFQPGCLTRELEFNVNVRDLRDAQIVEFGIITPK